MKEFGGWLEQEGLQVFQSPSGDYFFYLNHRSGTIIGVVENICRPHQGIIFLTSKWKAGKY